MTTPLLESEMADRIAELDWSSTSLGPIEGWPQSLKTSLSIILKSQMPMWLGWGPDILFFYNDAYIQVLSHAKHPWALGRPAAEVWKEIWNYCGPLAAQVYDRAEAPFLEDVRLFMDRGEGFLEEVYYSFSYSPIEDESGGVGGLFCPNTEVTAKLLHARRLRTLSALAGNALMKTSTAACASAAVTLATNRDDIPFALIYLCDSGEPRLEQAIGVTRDDAASLERAWPIAQVLATGRSVCVTIPSNDVLPPGLADQPVRQAMVLPIHTASQEQPLGVLVSGANPTRRLDAEYVTFFDLVAGQIATALQSALAAEEDRRRVEMLAELDRAKTTFFSNISHEFRTPLTLMIGPTEDALAQPGGALSGQALETVYRNELRLLKLVNALLDFSRLEAGRMVASLEPVDLPVLTAELASGFRSAIERAGLRFVVETQPLDRPIAIDRDMWEKIILNLLSNALKFTLEGEIRVSLRAIERAVELRVSDTGTGVPVAELPRLFERFYRVDNPRARTQEGSGIGLALVQELVKLHGGTVRVESVLGQGTAFIVTVPQGPAAGAAAASSALAPATPVAGRVPDAIRAAFVEEAGRWSANETVASRAPHDGERLLLADDNADMRDYVRRLLGEHWQVISVGDGATALRAALDDPPDLVVSDVMMPGLDGFELLAALRADLRTRHVPVILLSARAGDEARVEGLGAGADDYLVKPFSARELIARVKTHLALARARRQAEQGHAEMFSMMMQVPAAITVYGGPDAHRLFQNEAARRRVFPRNMDAWSETYQRALAGSTEVHEEVPVDGLAADGLAADEPEGTRYVDITWAPILSPGGAIEAVMAIAFDVTERVLARERAAVIEERRRLAFDAAGVGTWRIDLRTRLDTRDAAMNRLLGLPEADSTEPMEDFVARVHVDDRPIVDAAIAGSIDRGEPYETELRIVRPDGTIRWLRDVGRIVSDPLGIPVALTGAAVDITERQQLADAALAASRAKDEFLAMLGHELRNPLAPIVTAIELMKLRGAGGSRELSTIERQTRHLTALVDDLLDVSRVSRGLIELKRERLALRDVIARALEMASPLVDQRRHTVRVDVSPDLIVDGDPIRLAQVFANLFTNAARYTPEGGVITVAASLHADRIETTVIDNGVGIASELMPRIFDLFVQGASQGPQRSQGGLGIGLALVKSLVQLHGGGVTVTTNGPGLGSTFTVSLPEAPAQHPTAATGDVAEQATSSSPSGRRVLVVDDNIDAAEMLVELLEVFGHTVAMAHDGHAALAIIDGFKPDAAVVDIGLPEMDGYEVARRVRERGLDCRLIALTGYGQDQDRERSRRAGFDAHLVKPVSVEKLADLLRAPA